VNIISSTTMNNAGSSTQPVPNRVGRRRRSTHISVPQVSTEISHGNRRSRRARLNSIADQDSLDNECNYFFHNFQSICHFLFLYYNTPNNNSKVGRCYHATRQ
jgi:hypothetical protein